MTGRLTELRSRAPGRHPAPGGARVDLLPDGVRALSPAGDRVAHVTDRSGIPRLEVGAPEQRTASLSPLTVLERPTAPARARLALQAHGKVSDRLLLPGEGHTVGGRDHRVELSTRAAAWFDRWRS